MIGILISLCRKNSSEPVKNQDSRGEIKPLSCFDGRLRSKTKTGVTEEKDIGISSCVAES
jgi:hypothetical protein